MPAAAQGQTWSEILCCPSCGEMFGIPREPVTSICGHIICRPCTHVYPGAYCPIDQAENRYSLQELPTNSAILSIVGVQKDVSHEIARLLAHYGRHPEEINSIVECHLNLHVLAGYLRKANSERGGSVWSEVLSRTLQRKLVSLLCMQVVDDETKPKILRTLRSVAERVLSELLSHQQSSHSLSTQLWTAVRARGCQFLGPAMQEDVLKLILLTLSKGASIARKTLVMYIVQTLLEDYPQVSKTCVGHVVQLLYRASCFNVIKRDGESSLMQLKEEFRSYEALRREHDAQIVGMAVEAGLRISPDQWSALLYGDPDHRAHMQSIIDKLQSPQSFLQSIEELRVKPKAVPDRHKPFLFPVLHLFEALRDDHSWDETALYIDKARELLDIHIEISVYYRGY